VRFRVPSDSVSTLQFGLPSFVLLFHNIYFTPLLLHHLRLGQLPAPAVLAILPCPFYPLLFMVEKLPCLTLSFPYSVSRKISRQELPNLTDSEEVLFAHQQHCTVVANLYNHA